MTSVFVGGSRHVSRLPAPVKKRLDRITAERLSVIVGDANGVDKAVQKHLADKAYRNVTVFCSGDTLRNNVGHWPTRAIAVSSGRRDFSYFAAKDRAMATTAEYALMVWDGKSVGTMLNVLRMVRAGKIAVVYDVPQAKFKTFRSSRDWDGFLASAPDDMIVKLRERATNEEWDPSQHWRQTSLLDTPGWVTDEDRGEAHSQEKRSDAHEPRPESVSSATRPPSAVSEEVLRERANEVLDSARLLDELAANAHAFRMLLGNLIGKNPDSLPEPHRMGVQIVRAGVLRAEISAVTAMLDTAGNKGNRASIGHVVDVLKEPAVKEKLLAGDCFWAPGNSTKLQDFEEQYQALRNSDLLQRVKRLRNDVIAHVLRPDEETPTVLNEEIFALHTEAERLLILLFEGLGLEPDFTKRRAVIHEWASTFWDTYFSAIHNMPKGAPRDSRRAG